MRTLAVVGVLAGCAVTTTMCPTGAKLITAQKPIGRAEWCAIDDNPAAELPATSRSFEGVLGLGHPPAMAGGVEGPYTSWYPSGALHSHGRYVTDGTRSQPEGLWAFWHPDGTRWVIGMYHHGEPTGCFEEWDEHGELSTGTVQGDELHVSACTPPPDREVAILEGRARPPRDARAWADLSVQGFAGPNHLGAANDSQVSPDPEMTMAFRATARIRVGRLRVGPTVGAGFANDSEGKVLVAGASVGWELPRVHRRVDSEISAELAMQHIDIEAARTMQPGTVSLSFWSPIPALQAGVAITLTPNLAALVGARVDGVPRRSVDRDDTYCDFQGCYAPVHETWQIGGVSFGGYIGLRFMIR